MQFQGRYPCRWLANTGSPAERLDALAAAVAELYAAVLGPDPIEHRVAEGLIDFEEDMGMLIQPVVGAVHGSHFVPRVTVTATSGRDSATGKVTVCLRSSVDADAAPAAILHLGAASCELELPASPTPATVMAFNLATGARNPVAVSKLPDGLLLDAATLARDAELLATLRAALETLDTAFDAPMEIELAASGPDLYLLQCRKASMLR